MAESPNPIFKDEVREGEYQQPAGKRIKVAQLNIQVHFYVGEDLKSGTHDVCDIDIVHDSEIGSNDDLPALITYFKRHLVFKNYKLRGKLAHVDDNEVVSLPKLYPGTVVGFLDLLTAKEGEIEIFSNLDNLISAFVFATAIKDVYFQQRLIQDILAVVQSLHTSPDPMDKDFIFTEVLEKVNWAWSGSSMARIGLRRVLTMCYAWLSTADANKNSKNVKKSTNGSAREVRPALDLTALEKLGNQNPKWEQGLMQMFVQSCRRLTEHNKGSEMGWGMIPVTEVYPDNPTVDLTDD